MAIDPLSRLIDGNRQFVQQAQQSLPLTLNLNKEKMASEQHPFAVILSCADSRVPVELVFHQGLGDLFVVRVAGNIATAAQIGSIEYACQQLDTPLVVVLGHSQCGAVGATIDALSQDLGDRLSDNLRVIVEQVTPAVQPLLDAGEYHNHQALLSAAIRANVEQTVSDLQSRSAILKDRVRNNQLKIVGAHYDIASGQVEFY